MVRSSRRLALSLVLAVGITAPALAQVHDGADNSPAEQDIADQLRAKGSDCTAPACRNNAEGIYPQTTMPGVGAKTPSISSGHTQN